MASVESGNYRKFDNTNKSSFKKHSHDKSGGYKRPYDGQSSHQQGGNKRFKGKYVPKPKKPVVLDKKDRQELRKRRRAAKPNADAADKANRVYQVNISHMKKDDRLAETTRMLDEVRGKIYALSLRHDSSRSLQLLVKHGNAAQREEVFNELATHFRTLTINKTGHFIVLKLAQYCTETQRSAIIQELRGTLKKISLNPFGAQVVDQLYMHAGKPEQYTILREFIDTEYGVFSKSIFASGTVEQLVGGVNVASQQVIQIPSSPENLVQNLLDNAGPRKAFILDSIENYLNRAIEKEQLMFRYVHSILRQYLKYMTIESSMCREIIGSVSKYIPALHHSRDGVFAAIHCLAYGSNRDRKTALKSIKGRIVEFCLDDYAYLIVLRMIDVLDDTLATRKAILGEILDDAPYGTAPFLTQMTISGSGSKVLLYFLGSKTSTLFSQHELEYLAAPMAPAYLFAKNEKEDDAETTTTSAPLVSEEELEGLPAKEREALIAKAEEEAAQKRVAAKEAEEALRTTRSAAEMELVCTYKKSPESKVKELAYVIVPALIKSFLYSQTEATGQKGKATGATSNISLEEEADKIDEDLEELTQAQKDKQAEIVFTKSIPSKPFGYLESVLRHRVGLEVISYGLISGVKYAYEQAEIDAATPASNKKQQTKPFEGLIEIVDEVFKGIQHITTEGEIESDFIVCDPRGHLPIKRIAKSLSPPAKRTEFNKLLWESIQKNINVIASSGRGCFVLLAMYEGNSGIADEMKRTLKTVLPALNTRISAPVGFQLLFDLVINGKKSLYDTINDDEPKKSSSKKTEVPAETTTPRKRRRTADSEIASESDNETLTTKSSRRSRHTPEMATISEEVPASSVKKSSAAKKSSSKRS